MLTVEIKNLDLQKDKEIMQKTKGDMKAKLDLMIPQIKFRIPQCKVQVNSLVVYTEPSTIKWA